MSSFIAKALRQILEVCVFIVLAFFAILFIFVVSEVIDSFHPYEEQQKIFEETVVGQLGGGQRKILLPDVVNGEWEQVCLIEDDSIAAHIMQEMLKENNVALKAGNVPDSPWQILLFIKEVEAMAFYDPFDSYPATFHLTFRKSRSGCMPFKKASLTVSQDGTSSGLVLRED